MDADSSKPGQESQPQPVTSQSGSRWWDWWADPKVEAGILLVATLTALITWGLIER